jgi:hypothetical protein
MLVLGGAFSTAAGRLRRVSAEPPGNEEVAALATPRPAGFATKLMFAPVKLVARRAAPRLSARLFDRVWHALYDGSPPPRSEEPQPSVTKLGIALALEGACAAVVGGLVDQLSRRQFARLTGRWPGRRKRS